jgi:hypothetical protein
MGIYNNFKILASHNRECAELGKPLERRNFGRKPGNQEFGEAAEGGEGEKKEKRKKKKE